MAAVIAVEESESAASPGPEPALPALIPRVSVSSLVPSGERESSSAFKDVIVSDPHIEAGRFTSHVKYKTVLHHATDKSKNIEIQRRYRDFDWVRRKLLDEFPGRLVPPLPPKHIPLIEDPLDAEFVESRRRGLERFLRRVVAHPDLSVSSSFAVFLGADLAELDAKRSEETAPARVVDHIAHAAKRQSMRLFNYKEFQEMESTDIERNADFYDRLNIAEDYVSSLLKALALMKRTAGRSIVTQQDYAGDLESLADAFKTLSKCEAEGSLADPLQQLDHATRNLGSLTALQAENERLLFEDTLRDWLGVTSAVKDVIKDQGSARHRHQDARNALARAVLKRDKLRQKAATSDEIAAAEAAVSECESQVHDAGKALSTVKKMLFAEMARFNVEKGEALEEMCFNLVESRLEHSQKEVATWQHVRDSLPSRFGAKRERGISEHAGTKSGPVSAMFSGEVELDDGPIEMPSSPTAAEPVGVLDLSPPAPTADVPE